MPVSENSIHCFSGAVGTVTVLKYDRFEVIGIIDGCLELIEGGITDTV